MNLNRNTEESRGRHCEIGFGNQSTLKMSHLQFWLFFFMQLQQKDSLIRNSVILRIWPAFQNPVDKHMKIHIQLKTSLLVGVYILQESFRTPAMINRVILSGQMQTAGLLLTVLHLWTGPKSKFSR